MRIPTRDCSRLDVLSPQRHVQHDATKGSKVCCLHSRQKQEHGTLGSIWTLTWEAKMQESPPGHSD